VIRLIRNEGRVTSCRELLIILNILPVPCMYITEIVKGKVLPRTGHEGPEGE
jgi:hypothetical protein